MNSLEQVAETKQKNTKQNNEFIRAGRGQQNNDFIRAGLKINFLDHNGYKKKTGSDTFVKITVYLISGHRRLHIANIFEYPTIVD